MKKNYYQVLGVSNNADDVVIRAAYKALAQKYHPDKWGGTKDEANRLMSQINEAYTLLSDPIKRKQYDADLSSDIKIQNTEPKSKKFFSIKKNLWIKIALILIIGFIFIFAYKFFYSEYISKPIKSFQNISLGESHSEIEFRYGFLILNSPPDEFKIRDTNTYVYIDESKKVKGIAHYCDDVDATYLYKIKCGDSSDVVKKVLKKDLIVQCEVKNVVTNNPRRSYSSAEHGIRVIMETNKVIILGILPSERLSNINSVGTHWKDCN
jgi:hypothetical protein